MSHPTQSGVAIDASQQTLLESLPPVLIIQLKRFQYDTAVRDVVKVGKQVRFGPELDVGSELMSLTKRMHGGKYRLFGGMCRRRIVINTVVLMFSSVIYHHGLQASGGHYTIDVLHLNRDLSTKPREAWIRMDDEFVSDVRPEDVFGAPERDDRSAYLLFYRRVGNATRS